MLGRELIGQILDKDMANQEVRVVGLNDEGTAVDDSLSSAIAEIAMVEMDDGDAIAAIVIESCVVQ